MSLCVYYQARAVQNVSGGLQGSERVQGKRLFVSFRGRSGLDRED